MFIFILQAKFLISVSADTDKQLKMDLFFKCTNLETKQAGLVRGSFLSQGDHVPSYRGSFEVREEKGKVKIPRFWSCVIWGNLALPSLKCVLNHFCLMRYLCHCLYIVLSQDLLELGFLVMRMRSGFSR